MAPGTIEHMYVLGIDPGLSLTGYGIVGVAGSRLEPITAGVIRTPPDAAPAVRLAELAGDVESLLDEFAPAEVAIEQVFVNRNTRTAMAVGRASGVAMMVAARAGLSVFEYTPSAVKMAVCGYGDATKQQVQAMVARRLGLDEAPRPADAADALAVAICHVQSADMRRAVERAVG